MRLVPDDFVIPLRFDGQGFRLEPLGPQHNERDYDAWTRASTTRATSGFPDGSWPRPMTIDANLADLVRHADDFEHRSGFTSSILDGDEVIGCVYIYPSEIADAAVSSWVRGSRAATDSITLAGDLDLARRRLAVHDGGV